MLLSRDDPEATDVATRRRRRRAEPRSSPLVVWLLAGLVVAAAVAAGWWARMPLLDDSLWWDEISSAHIYVGGGLGRITDPLYYGANNHILYNLWTWFAVGWFGEGEFAVRFLGLVPAVLAAVIATGWSLRRLGPAAGAVVAVLFATSPLHVDVSTLGRGWGLALLSVVWMLVGSVELGRLGRAAEAAPDDRDPGEDVRVGRIWVHLAGYGVAGIIGTFTILPLAIPFTVHALPLLRWRRLRWRVVATGAIVGTACLAWYAEVLEAVVTYTSRVGTNQGVPVQGLSWLSEGWNRLLRPHLAPFAGSGTVLDAESPWLAAAEVAVIVAVVTLVGVALVTWWRAGGIRQLLAVHLVVGYVGTFLVMWALGANVVDRYVSFLLAHVLVAVAGGTVIVLRHLVAWLTTMTGARSFSVVVGSTVAIAATALPAAGLAGHREATTVAPYEAVADAAALVESADADVVITNRTNGFVVFRYYLGDTFEIIPPANIGRRLCREVRYHPDHVIAFLDYPFPEAGPSGDPSCLVLRDTTRTVLPQRRATGQITVWISRPRG